MDGPDLSHLLDDPNPERPSRELLDVIVRRRRRMQARRARTAATLGLVIALAGAGVGISLSRKGGTTMSASTKGPAQVPTMSNRISATAPSPVSRSPVSSGNAPEGLGWVNAESTVGYSASALSPSPATIAGGQSGGELHVTSTGSGTSLCSVWNCSPNSPYGSIGDAQVRHLFTRTSDGVTVRAFTAVWVAAPLELVPTPSGSASTATGPSVPTATGPAATGPTVAEPTVSVATPPTRVTPVSCALTQALLVEVSDAGAVGVVTVPLGPSVARPLNELSDQVVGVAEGSPITLVVAHTTGRTAAVRADFGAGGKDEMVVVDQWAVLVHRFTAAKAGGTGSRGSATPGQVTVYALSGTGEVLERADVPGSGATAMAVAACSVLNGGVHKIPGASASGSPGSGGSGALGSTGSGEPATSVKPSGG